MDKRCARNCGTQTGGNTDFADGLVLLEAPCEVGSVLVNDVCVDINACAEVGWKERGGILVCQG